MDGLNLLKKLVFKNKNLLRQIRPLHVSSAQAFKSVAPRESLNSEYVLHYLFYEYKHYLIIVFYELSFVFACVNDFNFNF